MEFKELFNPLKKCLGDGHNRQYFFRDLMAMITTVSEDEWGTPLDPNTKRTKDNTIFSFIKRGLSQTFAQSIVNRLTPKVLRKRIKERPAGTRETLAKELSVYDSGINANNVDIKATDMLVKIITKAAGLMSDEEIAIKSFERDLDLMQETASGNISSSIISESDKLSARKFLINHENEKELIPLCQIALLYSPEQKYVRDMYTEYLLLPKIVQRLILKSCNADSMINIDSLHLEEAMTFFCKDLEKYELSSQRYIYLFDQYLNRAFSYYSDCSIKTYDNNSFKRLLNPSLKAAKNMEYASIDAYIDDYLWMKENKLDVDAIPPMDYLWNVKDLGSCNEENLTYWLCRFVIDVCINLFHRVKKCDFDYVDVYDQYAETQEDLYFCAVNALYNHYLCHAQSKSEQD